MKNYTKYILALNCLVGFAQGEVIPAHEMVAVNTVYIHPAVLVGMMNHGATEFSFGLERAIAPRLSIVVNPEGAFNNNGYYRDERSYSIDAVVGIRKYFTNLTMGWFVEGNGYVGFGKKSVETEGHSNLKTSLHTAFGVFLGYKWKWENLTVLCDAGGGIGSKNAREIYGLGLGIYFLERNFCIGYNF